MHLRTIHNQESILLMICPQNTKLWYMFDTHVNKLITFTPGHFYAIKLYITFLSYSKLSIWYAISFDIAEVLWYAITCTASSFFFNINSFTLIGGQLLYNIALALPYINMNPPQVYTCSPFWTPLPSPSPYHPSGSSQCTSPKHPVSCSEPGLAIHFIYGFYLLTQAWYPK